MNSSRFKCTSCNQPIADGDPYLVKNNIVCKKCHDLMQPHCPYCGVSIRRGKIPMRRSTFKCKACDHAVVVDPTQYLFESPYMTERHAMYWMYVATLNAWVEGAGSREDYEQMKQLLRDRFGFKPNAADIVWGLMNKSILECCQNEFEVKRIEGLKKEFREFEQFAKSNKLK